MTPSNLDQFRQQLLAMTQQFSSDAASLSFEGLSTVAGDSAGELSSMPSHIGDRGSEEYLAAVNCMMLENEEHLIRETHAALGRIQEGTFGTCAQCEEPIPRERLEAIPYARCCVQCAEKTEAASAVI